MAFEDILQEANQLHGVGQRLRALADNTPIMSEQLMTISANVLGIATVLEVLVVAKSPKPV